ncbi:hypothetical protein [Streptomyces sp. NBRC 110028]|uniref:hypothetical protein n=1 Tax=Streptomyces sp. NBRC 110028 TaxID=1621260 RepID=UPI0006E24F42|nr:hypothetical protein [Streptomyces sp. NBRC 110028]
MAGLRDFLLRFRPVGSPGRAAPGGVPADRTAELTAELQPPLSLLEEAEEEARRIRDGAAREAAERRRAAERRAREIVGSAQDRARQARTTSAARIRRDAEAEAAELLATAQREAVAVRRRAEERMPRLLDRVADLVAEDIEVPPAPAGDRPQGAGRRGP